MLPLYRILDNNPQIFLAISSIFLSKLADATVFSQVIKVLRKHPDLLHTVEDLDRASLVEVNSDQRDIILGQYRSFFSRHQDIQRLEQQLLSPLPEVTLNQADEDLVNSFIREKVDSSSESSESSSESSSKSAEDSGSKSKAKDGSKEKGGSSRKRRGAGFANRHGDTFAQLPEDQQRLLTDFIDRKVSRLVKALFSCSKNVNDSNQTHEK